MRRHRWVLTVLLGGCVGAVEAARADDAVEALLSEPCGWAQASPPEPKPLVAPGEDASQADVVRYWLYVANQRREMGMDPFDPTVPITATMRVRLLAGCVADPKVVVPLIGYLPDEPAAYKAMYEVYTHPAGGFQPDDEWKQTVHWWLMLRSEYFRDDLVAAARDVKLNRYGQLENGDARAALAKLDWKAAEPILEQDARNNAYFAVGAIGLFYEHALAAHDKIKAVKLRAALVAWATDKKAAGFVRSSAFDTLIKNDWEARGEWMGQQLADESLMDLQEGENHLDSPFYAWAKKAPKEAVQVATAALGDPQRRARAVHVLMIVNGPEGLRPLLDCLVHPKDWPERLGGRVVESLDQVELPESVPGIVEWSKGADGAGRVDAALALARQKAKEAPAALKATLPLAGTWSANRMLDALLATGEYAPAEIVEAMEAGVSDAMESRQEGNEEGNHKALIARMLFEKTRDRAGVAEAVIARAAALRRERPAVAEGLWDGLVKSSDAAVDRECLRRLENEPLELPLMKFAIERGARMRVVAEGLRELAKSGGEKAGLAACLLGDAGVEKGILEGNDQAAQRMLLAAGRAGRFELPLPAVGKVLNGKDAKMLAVAEKFLLADDTAEARELVRGHHPGEFLVLSEDELLAGDKKGKFSTRAGDELLKLIKEMRGNGAPDEIFALYSAGGFGNDGQRVIRIRGAVATLDYVSPDGKAETITLSDAEEKAFMGLVRDQHVDDLAPVQTGVQDGLWFDYFHLTKTGGRHILFDNPWVQFGAGAKPAAFVEAFRNLTESRKPPPAKTPFD